MVTMTAIFFFNTEGNNPDKTDHSIIFLTNSVHKIVPSSPNVEIFEACFDR